MRRSISEASPLETLGSQEFPGEFKKEVDVGRSLAAHRRQHAKTKLPKGEGDHSDTEQKRRELTPTAFKTLRLIARLWVTATAWSVPSAFFTLALLMLTLSAFA